MIYFNEKTGLYEPFRLRVTFYDRETQRVKYDHNEQYWREFVNRWWHHTGLKFEANSLSPAQQARLDEVNAQLIPAQWLGEVADYVEFGSVEVESTCPYLADLVNTTAVQEARLERVRQVKRQELAGYRYKIETSGVTTEQGVHVLTDRESQGQLNAAYTTLDKGFVTAVDWKSATGWVQVTLTELTPLAQACSKHVQECFTAERRVDEALTAMLDEAALTEFDVRVEFDQARLELQTAPSV
jgi:hypothetical protein